MKKFVVIGAFLAAIVVGWCLVSLRPADYSSGERKSVKIEQGMSVSQIAGLLSQKGIIRSTKAFMIYVKFKSAESSLQAGTFVMRPSMKAGEILEVLVSGKSEEMIITIPEGFTVKEIDELLKEKGIIEGGEVVACANKCDFSSFSFLPSGEGQLERGGKLEGYLFPDTYYVNADEFVPKFFLERMLTAFRRRVLEAFPDEFSSTKRSLHQIVTMAALIEEEALADDERPAISGVLWKRFDAGLGLGVDASVRYLLEKQTGAITAGDLNANSPYNTRKFKGLPPGPIANPGAESLRAALFPKESEYWYYLHGKDGAIHYAKTNEEHNTNKYLYLK